MNPKAPSSFPIHEEMIFYARLPVEFRMCMGLEVVPNELFTQYFPYSTWKVGKSREDQYPACKNGKYNQATGRYEGGLSRIEKYYYQTMLLHQNVSYDSITETN
jgi:hypothetical protein